MTINKLALESRFGMQTLLNMGPAARAELLSKLTLADQSALQTCWRFWARPEQLAPPGDWRTWLILGGRGFGKTRAGAEWVRSLAEGSKGLRIALVAATLNEAREVMVEGDSGLLAIAPEGGRPRYEPSRRRLVWPRGSQAFLYGASEAEGLRGPQHHHAWADEVAKWPNGEQVWDNLLMGLRLGRQPRVVATTTPRPVPLVRRLLKAGPDEGVVVTRGGTDATRAHLAPGFLAAMQVHRGTRLGRQELNGELIEEVEGALWSRALIERCRRAEMPAARRTVVAVDPPASAEGDACGIVVAALAEDDAAYVVEDATVERASPERWARAVAEAAARHGADRVIAEANNGGSMVESVLRAGNRALPVRLVHATRSKTARAEPVAALYEAGRVFHLGSFPALEDQLAGLLVGGGYQGPGRSPDRADALVWAMGELLLARAAVPGMRVI